MRHGVKGCTRLVKATSHSPEVKLEVTALHVNLLCYGKAGVKAEGLVGIHFLCRCVEPAPRANALAGQAGPCYCQVRSRHLRDVYAVG